MLFRSFLAYTFKEYTCLKNIFELFFTFLTHIKDPLGYKHLKNSNAACFYTPVVLKLLIIIQMW